MKKKHLFVFLEFLGEKFNLDYFIDSKSQSLHVFSICMNFFCIFDHKSKFATKNGQANFLLKFIFFNGKLFIIQFS